MAIVRTKTDNLAETKIVEVKKTNIDSDKPKENKPIKHKKRKKKGFFGTTLEELKKVNWPSKKYVIIWSTTVIIFTIFFSLFLGFFDHIFNSGLKYIECTSPQGDNNSLDDCNKKLINNLTFRN